VHSTCHVATLPSSPDLRIGQTHTRRPVVLEAYFPIFVQGQGIKGKVDPTDMVESVVGTKPTSLGLGGMPAFEGKTDMARIGCHVGSSPKADMSAPFEY
jgi:hypothetical protein